MSEENTNVNPENNNQTPIVQQEQKMTWWDVTKTVLKTTAGIGILGLAVVGGISLVKHFGGSVTEAAAEAANELL